MTRRPAIGYGLALAAATMWALNSSISRALLDDGVDALRLAQLRATGAWALLVVALAVGRRELLRVRRADLPALAFLGVAGLALVHVTYFVAIERLQIGVAVTIQYLAPLLLLLWLRFRHGRRLGGGLWGAVALSVSGCFLAVRGFDAGALDALGLVAAFGAALSFTIYLAGAERAGHRLQPVTTLAWALGFAAAAWALALPWWRFPFDQLGSAEAWALAAGVIVVGTLLPFAAMLAAVRHIPGPRAAIVATLEPVLSAVFAWLLHDEGLAAIQLAGGALVLAAVVWVQARPADPDVEYAPLREAR